MDKVELLKVALGLKDPEIRKIAREGPHEGQYVSVAPLTFGRGRINLGPDELFIDHFW